MKCLGPRATWKQTCRCQLRPTWRSMTAMSWQQPTPTTVAIYTAGARGEFTFSP